MTPNNEAPTFVTETSVGAVLEAIKYSGSVYLGSGRKVVHVLGAIKAIEDLIKENSELKEENALLTVEKERLESLIPHPGDGSCEFCGCSPAVDATICESCYHRFQNVNCEDAIDDMMESVGLFNGIDYEWSNEFGLDEAMDLVYDTVQRAKGRIVELENKLKYYEETLTIESSPLTKLQTGEAVLTIDKIKIGELLNKYVKMKLEVENLKILREHSKKHECLEHYRIREFEYKIGIYEKVLHRLASLWILPTRESQYSLSKLMQLIYDWSRSGQGEYTSEEIDKRFEKAFQNLSNGVR